MTIRVARGTVTQICDAPGAFAVQVQQPSDLGGALVAARGARTDILALDAGEPSQAASVHVVAAPGGPLVHVEWLDAPYDALRGLPELIRQRLQEAGVEQATIAAVASGGRLDELDQTANAVVLRLFPPPAGAAGAIPPDWIDAAAEWALADLGDLDTVVARLLSVEFDVSASEASGVLHEARLGRAWCDLVNGSLDDRIRTASITFGRLPHVALAAGGPGADATGLLARFGLLQDIARELAADVAYACIDFEPAFDGLALGLSPAGWQEHGGVPPNVVASDFVDEFVPDAYPFQVLGPGHLAKLEREDPAPCGEPLSDGRVELLIGAPSDWLLTSTARDDAQEEGWQFLAPCLAKPKDIEGLAASRAAAPDVGPVPPDGGDDPILDAIVLEAAPHNRRGTRLTLLELVSWLDHEPHSDQPTSVSPVVAAFARWWAAGLDDSQRQRLKPAARDLSGTNGQPARDQQRRWAATDWLVRVQAPAWLRLAGLTDAADELEALGSLTDKLELVRAVDVLGSAITTSSRWMESPTASIDGDPDDEQLGWEAWERVSEVSAWVAASEASTEDAPAELTYATDLRVIECSRDPRTREEIAAARVSVGDTAWSTALHAMASEAWEQGWRAADAASRKASGLSLRAEMLRLARTTMQRATAGDELPDAALEVADNAARDSLTRAALRGGAPDPETGDHPWDMARQAARSSARGRAWAVLLDEARRAVGEDGWAQAMADARAATDRVLAGGPDLVARAVAAAVAREACSAAARGVAIQAAAVARANGGDDDAAADAAAGALSATADGLREAAFELLATLVAR